MIRIIYALISFYDVFDKDESGNILYQDNITIDSTGNLVQSEEGKLVAMIGVNDLIVIDSHDALLICKKDQSQKVKDVVEILTAKNDIRTKCYISKSHP